MSANEKKGTVSATSAADTASTASVVASAASAASAANTVAESSSSASPESKTDTVSSQVQTPTKTEQSAEAVKSEPATAESAEAKSAKTETAKSEPATAESAEAKPAEAKPVEADPDALRFIDVIDGSHLLSEMTPAAQALEQLERLDGSQLKALVEQQDFGGLQHVTSESLLEALGTRAWKKLCAEVLSDVSSFFSYEPATATQSAALVCHMPEYMVKVTFKATDDHGNLVSCTCGGVKLGRDTAKSKGEDKTKDTKDTKDTKEPENAQNQSAADTCTADTIEAGDGTDSACIHQRMAQVLYLMLTQQLQCDDTAYQLFFKRERYTSYFTQVKELLSQIFAQGLSNLNYDVLDKVKAAFVRANSFDIAFLENDLKKLHELLKVGLEQRQAAHATGVLNLSCRIYNTLEALEHATERRELVKLYGVNQDREYAIASLKLFGCGYQHVTRESGDTSKLFYFYSPERDQFMTMAAVKNSFFASPTNFMNSETSLYEAAYRVYHIENAMMSSGKLKNSKFSVPQEYEVPLQLKKQLFAQIALPDFAALKREAYASVPRYFDRVSTNNQLFLVKIKRLVQIAIDPQEWYLKVYFEDEQSQIQAVRVSRSSSYYDFFTAVDGYTRKVPEAQDFLLQHQDLWDGVITPNIQAQLLAELDKMSEQERKERDAELDKDKQAKAKASKAEQKAIKSKVLKRMKVAQELLQITSNDQYLSYILLYCPLQSGRIRPMLASIFSVVMPDRKHDASRHKKLVESPRLKERYIHASQWSPFAEFQKALESNKF